ncbi:hypothetical protein ACWD4V_01080 [Streptomyces tsukubensis]
MNATEPSPLLGDVAQIACGPRQGKTRPCAACQTKAPGLLTLAYTGTPEALAAAICGTTPDSCQDCKTKAETIISKTAQPPRAA